MATFCYDAFCCQGVLPVPDYIENNLGRSECDLRSTLCNAPLTLAECLICLPSYGPNSRTRANSRRAWQREIAHGPERREALRIELDELLSQDAEVFTKPARG